MNRSIYTIALLYSAIAVTATSCATKRPYMCNCTNDSMARSYDIDVKTRAEADAKCAQYTSQNGWKSCSIMLHE